MWKKKNDLHVADVHIFVVYMIYRALRPYIYCAFVLPSLIYLKEKHFTSNLAFAFLFHDNHAFEVFWLTIQPKVEGYH